MEVENQEHFEEGIGEQKQLDTSEETEDGLMEQRGEDALEHQDDGVVDKEDKEVVGATESLGDMTGQEDVELSTKQVSELEEEDRGVVPADLEVKVHVPKEEGCNEEDTEQSPDPEQDDSGTENEGNAGDRKPAELELMVHVPKEVGFDAKEKDEPQDKGDDDKVTDLDEDPDADVAKDGRIAADLELLVHNPENDAEKNSETGRLAADLELHVQDSDKEKISEIPKEPEIQKVPADLELRVNNADTDSEKPKSGKEPAELELLVQKDENDNDDNIKPAEIHRNGDLKTQEKPETEIKAKAKAKAKAGSVKNSIAKFNNTETKKDKGMFITVQPDKCSACERTVYAMEKLEMNKNIYHRGCFKCSHCSATLTAKTFSINEGVIYCTTHFKQLFARKGNYDEGFGRQQYKKKWVEDQLKNKDATA